MQVNLYDRGNSEFIVDEITSTGGRIALSNCRISLSGQICDYSYFQALHYACCHVLAACSYCRLDWRTYIDDVYRVNIMFNVYKMDFSPSIHDGLLLPFKGPQVIPDLGMMRASIGRLIINSMNDAN
ncbi:uncharacterized protein DS421_10g295900 [Arachis hypogaea]|uniref:Uncharacterized protein n=1 Tax=Arachis hypogaea TaxID=3818 RepID=A0A445B924_ARAHY|nr:uncharacterized protein DS421_10g295900 [Arachis hypogaea]RYR35159.1 hypothetical protein Ahy_A10g050293 [Arachis hypogaea]